MVGYMEMTSTFAIEIDGIRVEVVRKRIRNMHLRVYPPDGRVVLSVPMAAAVGEIRRLLVERTEWIRQHQGRLAKAKREVTPQYVTGEVHWLLGKAYQLKIVSQEGLPRVVLGADETVYLFVPEGSDAGHRRAVLNAWYRQRLKLVVPPLFAKWEPVMGVKVAEWGVRQMRTKWGTCNIKARRIWLNLELAKRPFVLIEYLVVHELNHLLERLHNRRFQGLMDQFLPEWKQLKRELNEKLPGGDGIGNEEMAGLPHSRTVASGPPV